MSHHPCLLARSFLAGTAEVKDGLIRCTTGNGEESFLPAAEVLDEASSHCHQDLRRKCLVALPRICSAHRTLPPRYLVTGHLAVDYNSTVCVGGADVRRGTLDGGAITVKSVPLHMTSSSSDSKENAYREAITWKNLKNPNILPLLGVDTAAPPFSFVSPSMEYGSLREYLVHFPGASRSKLLFDASQGLEYMHNLDCIHGDLKACNVLVNSDHSAVLSNFRLASFIPEPEVDVSFSIPECDLHSARWLAPEQLFPTKFGMESVRCTKETDVYTFAMVMYEAFSGLFPFHDAGDEMSILLVKSGRHPSRPEGDLDLGLTDEIWNMMKTCWQHSDQRWSISCIVPVLESHSPVVAGATG